MNIRSPIQPPEMNTVERDALLSSRRGIIRNSDTGKYETYQQGAWVEWGGTSSSSGVVPFMKSDTTFDNVPIVGGDTVPFVKADTTFDNITLA